MPYNSNIPQPGDELSQSQADLLNNFIAIGTMLAPNNGAVTFPQQGANVATGATTVALISKAGVLGAGTQLFYQPPSSAAPIEFTASVKAASGWTMLPSGIMLQWGSFTMAGGNATQSFALLKAFPTANLSVTATPNASPSGSHTDIIMAIASTGIQQITAYRKQNFGTACSFNFLAIGY